MDRLAGGAIGSGWQSCQAAFVYGVAAIQAFPIAAILQAALRSQDLFKILRSLVRLRIVDDLQGVLRRHVLEIGHAVLSAGPLAFRDEPGVENGAQFGFAPGQDRLIGPGLAIRSLGVPVNRVVEVARDFRDVRA